MPAENNASSIRLKRLPAILTLLAGAFLLVAAGLPFSAARAIGDRLASDGSLEMLTPQRWQAVRLALLAGGLLFAVAGAAWNLFPRRVYSWLDVLWRGARAFPAALAADVRQSGQDALRRLKDARVWGPLLGMTLLAVLARLWFLQSPVQHDEAYTFVAFARLPLRQGLADYHFPNNHLFHTLLLHIAYRLFGAQVWMLRLPAFLAGVLLVPAGYWLARRLYGPTAAFLAGAALAASPVLIRYATNARGYSLLALFSVLAFLTATGLRRRPGPLRWCLLALIYAFGFYTLPIMAYPALVVSVWLGLVWLSGDFSGGNRRQFATGLVFSALGAALMAGLLYLPVFLGSGIGSVFNNPYVEPLTGASFWPTLQSRLAETWTEWNQDVPAWVVWVAVGGLLASLVYHPGISRERIPLQLAALAFPLLVLVQRPNLWARTWQWLFPLLLIWAAGGVLGLLRAFTQALGPAVHLRRIPISSLAAGGLALALMAGSFGFTLKYNPGLRTPAGYVEQAASYLKDTLRADEMVVIAPMDDTPLWFYFYVYDLRQDALRRDLPFRTAYVFVNAVEGQTLDQVLEQRGPDRGFLQVKQAVKLTRFGPLDLYRIEADHAAVSRAYPGFSEEVQP